MCTYLCRFSGHWTKNLVMPAIINEYNCYIILTLIFRPVRVEKCASSLFFVILIFAHVTSAWFIFVSTLLITVWTGFDTWAVLPVHDVYHENNILHKYRHLVTRLYHNRVFLLAHYGLLRNSVWSISDIHYNNSVTPRLGPWSSSSSDSTSDMLFTKLRRRYGNKAIKATIDTIIVYACMRTCSECSPDRYIVPI